MRAVCTWGEGPDVLLDLDGSMVFLLEPVRPGISVNGHVTKGQISLTAGEARELARSLLAAASQADELEQSLQNYFDSVGEE